MSLMSQLILPEEKIPISVTHTVTAAEIFPVSSIPTFQFSILGSSKK